jgi:hypothetical protein
VTQGICADDLVCFLCLGVTLPSHTLGNDWWLLFRVSCLVCWLFEEGYEMSFLLLSGNGSSSLSSG